jgi:ribosomal-protein-alanine N-acetyltransferase
VKAPSHLHTQRLALATPGHADVAEIFERYASVPEVVRYMGWPCHRSLADTETFLEFSQEQWRRWPAGPYLIRLRSDGELVGSTGLEFEAPGRASTGYVLARQAWGLGYATEALTAMIRLAGRLGVATLCAICHPQHQASSRVLEKCGFCRDTAQRKRIEFPNLVPGLLQEALCYRIAPPAASCESPVT